MSRTRSPQSSAMSLMSEIGMTAGRDRTSARGLSQLTSPPALPPRGAVLIKGYGAFALSLYPPHGGR